MVLVALTLLFQESPAAPVALFNGKDLSGWTTWLGDTKREDPRKVFTVQDGMVRISGDGFGYLATEKEYRDYRLVVEFKWGSKNWRGREKNARDSGLFLHATGPEGNSVDGNGAFRCAIECQIMQGRVGDLMLIKGKDADGKPIPVSFSAEIAPGRDAEGWPTWKAGGDKVTLRQTGRLNWSGIDPGWKDVLVENAQEDWTTVDCRCDGARISVRVNGVLVNEAVDCTPKSGRILLQCEGSEIFFRRVELLPLSSVLER